MNNFASQKPTSRADPENAIPSTINPISDNPTVDTTREWSPRLDAINTTRPMTITIPATTSHVDVENYGKVSPLNGISSLTMERQAG